MNQIMNQFGLDSSQWHEADKEIQAITLCENKSPIMYNYIRKIMYTCDALTPLHKTVLYNLHQKGFSVNESSQGPMIFSIVNINLKLNEYPRAHALDLLQFLVDHCDANILVFNHQYHSFPVHLILEYIEHSGSKVTLQLYSSGFDSKGVDEIQLISNITQSILKIMEYVFEKVKHENHFILHFLLNRIMYGDDECMKILYMFLPFCTDSCVQRAIDYIFPTGIQPSHPRISKKYSLAESLASMIYKHGFLFIEQQPSKGKYCWYKIDDCSFYSLFI